MSVFRDVHQMTHPNPSNGRVGMRNGMTVIVNGESRPVPAEASVLDLLTGLGLDPRSVVVELNRTIIRRQALADTALHDGDRVELVHFVGGG